MPLLPLFAACALAQADPLPEISFDLARAQAQNREASIAPENDPARQARVRKALAHAFARYPAGFLAQNVRTVYVVRAMADDGAGYGGLTGEDGTSVLITDGDDDGVDGDWIETVFHHETAHVLMEDFHREFSRRAWRDATDPGFRYAHPKGDGGMAAILQGEDDATFTPTLNAQGPLNPYGASCFDEDWATYAQNVVDPSPEFRDLVRRYDYVARRAALVEDFYERIVPGWEPSPFRSTL